MTEPSELESRSTCFCLDASPHHLSLGYFRESLTANLIMPTHKLSLDWPPYKYIFEEERADICECRCIYTNINNLIKHSRLSQTQYHNKTQITSQTIRLRICPAIS